MVALPVDVITDYCATVILQGKGGVGEERGREGKGKRGEGRRRRGRMGGEERMGKW